MNLNNKKNGYKTIQNEHIYAGIKGIFDLQVLYGGHSRRNFEQITSITKSVPRRTLVQLMNSYIMAFDTTGELLNKLTPNQKKYYGLSDYSK